MKAADVERWERNLRRETLRGDRSEEEVVRLRELIRRQEELKEVPAVVWMYCWFHGLHHPGLIHPVSPFFPIPQELRIYESRRCGALGAQPEEGNREGGPLRRRGGPPEGADQAARGAQGGIYSSPNDLLVIWAASRHVYLMSSTA